ncbi:hypothetical protein E2C01_048753 [Portunus trituberculatus]|uniref:Uncharacterized protein n=1 Tax=Portunus trituberculatus TaxID=210409 RepID=A0A5B7GBD3_PORTR|nr:hypothetical protein [Portunus trituberculatus]
MRNKEVYMETGQSRVAYDQSSTPGRTLNQPDPPRRRGRRCSAPSVRAKPLGWKDHDAARLANGAVMLVRGKVKTVTDSLRSAGMSGKAFPLAVN